MLQRQQCLTASEVTGVTGNESAHTSHQVGFDGQSNDFRQYMVTEVFIPGSTSSCQLWVSQRTTVSLHLVRRDDTIFYIIEHRRGDEDVGNGVSDEPRLTGLH